MAKRITKKKTPHPVSWRDQLKDYGLGFMLGLGGLSLCFASINGRVTDDRKLYENLTEIRAQKQKDLNFDGDLAALRAAENRFHEKNLPRPQLKQAQLRRSVRKPLSVSGAVRPRGRQLAPNPGPSTAKKWTGNARGRS